MSVPSDLAQAYGALLDGSAVAARTRDRIRAEGKDTISFLHGQLTQDVSGMAVGETRWSLSLLPQGKVVGLVRLTRRADDAVDLDTDAGHGERVRSALERFKLRTKCVLALDEAVPMLSGWAGPAPPDSIPMRWGPVCGFDILNPQKDDRQGRAVVDEAAYEVLRIEYGVTRNGAELHEAIIPAETGVLPITVSFTKGCYVGQELVARIDSRGHVNRHLRGLDLERDEVAAAGASLVRPSDRKEVGTLTSAARHPVTGRGIALGYLRREVAPGDIVIVASPDGDWAATVRELSILEP